jgi:membrane protein YdbS with pleckstrin-like domain
MENMPMDMTLEKWLPMDPAYLKATRIKVSIIHAIGVVLVVPFAWFLPAPVSYICLALIALLLCSFLWLFFVWGPKTCARTRYLVRAQDVSLQKGFMFWKLVSVSFNRIQHLEVSQGPIERAYGIATLVIFTAGTLGSDLQIPGLTLAAAQQLKAQLLDNINAEEVDEPI